MSWVYLLCARRRYTVYCTLYSVAEPPVERLNTGFDGVMLVSFSVFVQFVFKPETL